MKIEGISNSEFLHNIKEREDFTKELLLEIDDKELYFPIYYRDYKNKKGEEFFNIYFTNNNDFLKYKSFFKKKEYRLSITENHWGFSGVELKIFPGEKKFILCKIVRIRGIFLKTKIL